MKLRRILLIVFGFFSVLPAVLAGLFAFTILSMRTKELAAQNVEAISQLQAQAVENFFEENSVGAAVIAALPSVRLALATQEPEEMMRAQLIIEACETQTPHIKRVTLLDAHGMIAACSTPELVGKTATLQEKYLLELHQGTPVVTGLYPDGYGQDALGFAIAHPVKDRSQYFGAVVYHMDIAFFDTLIQRGVSLRQGDVTIMDATNLVASASSSYSFTRLEDWNGVSNLPQKALQSGGNRVFDYTIEGKAALAYITRLEPTGWSVLCSVPRAAYSVTPEQVALVGAVTLSIMLLLMWALYHLLEKILMNPLDALAAGIRRVDGGDYTRTAPVQGPAEFREIGAAFNKMMHKIRHDTRELAIKEERYRIAGEQSNSIIFDYDVDKGTLQCSPSGCELWGYPCWLQDFPDAFIQSELVHDEDLAAFTRLFEMMCRGQRNGAMELRLRTYKDTYCWFSLLMTAITDSATCRPLRIVGKMTNIDEEKRTTEQLTFQAERDPLTGLYNKAAAQNMIARGLAERADDSYYALMLIDVDDFKRVNDSYGHQTGDRVLSETARVLTNTFRANDVVGRVGGDEFMVLVRGMPSIEAVRIKARALLEAVRGIALDAPHEAFLAASVGIALYPRDGASFAQLYASADKAMYAAKRAGKNSFTFYRQQSAEITCPCPEGEPKI